ncbi:hypothetical protein BVX99_03015 [bacterium F16]|nr:hypothetical protein BVX99_03015 [bacterium F16]
MMRKYSQVIGFSVLLAMILLASLKLIKTSISELRVKRWGIGVEAYAPIFESVKHDVSGERNLGYICGAPGAPIWNGGSEEAMYFMSQYFLCPTLIFSSSPHPLVRQISMPTVDYSVGFFKNEETIQQAVLTGEWRVLRGYGRGIFLLQRTTKSE